jgi:hypothetical protein
MAQWRLACNAGVCVAGLSWPVANSLSAAGRVAYPAYLIRQRNINKSKCGENNQLQRMALAAAAAALAQRHGMAAAAA